MKRPCQIGGAVSRSRVGVCEEAWWIWAVTAYCTLLAVNARFFDFEDIVFRGHQENLRMTLSRAGRGKRRSYEFGEPPRAPTLEPANNA